MIQEIESTSKRKPGEKALEAMKLVNDLEVGLFKKPTKPLVSSRSKTKKVFDEDVYIREMGKIIQRDFFPDLEKLKAQNEYLEAVEKNDVQKMRELYAKYSSGRRPPTERYASPANFETPQTLRREDEPSGTPDNSDAQSTTSAASKSAGASESERKLSLDEYLNTATSEDNQSFQEIMHEAELKHRHKFEWLYDAEMRSITEVKDMLALPSIEEQANCMQRPLMVDTWGYKNKNYIMYVPDGVALTAAEEVEQAKRRKAIVHDNTRLAQNPFDELQNRQAIAQMAHNQAHSIKDGRIGIDGKEVSASDSPRVRGFSFVATPSPAPGVSESPLMTWGEIEGTPFRLDGGDTPLLPGTRGPSFRIAEPPKREKLAHGLAERAGEWHRDKKKRAIIAARKQLGTPSPRAGGTLDRLSSMSPAARRLASTQLRRHVGTDRALQASYSPRHTPAGQPTPSPATAGRSRTPRAGITPRAGARPNLNITDDLLNIPKRPRAADFFES